jgi:hypothetical protein
MDEQYELIDRLNLNDKDLTKLNKALAGHTFSDGSPVTWQALPAEELSKMLTGRSVKELETEGSFKTREYQDLISNVKNFTGESLHGNYSKYMDRTAPDRVKEEEDFQKYQQEQAQQADFEKNKERNAAKSFGKSLWGTLRYDLPSAALALTAAAAGSGGGQFSGIGDQIKDIQQGIDPNEGQKARDLQKKLSLVLASKDLQDQGAEYKKYLVSNLEKVSDPIDAMNWVFSALGQATGQIPATIATGGASSFIQETGSIYLDGLMKLQKESGKTIEQLIKDGDDKSLAPLVYGISAALLDRVGAKGVAGTFGKEEVLKAFQDRALAIARAGGIEGVTEFAQTGLEQIGANQMAGKTWAETYEQMDWSEMIEAAAQGIVGGTGLASMGPVVSGATTLAGKAINGMSGLGKTRTFGDATQTPEAKPTETVRDPEGNVTKPAESVPTKPPVDPNSAESVIPEHELVPEPKVEVNPGVKIEPLVEPKVEVAPEVKPVAPAPEAEPTPEAKPTETDVVLKNLETTLGVSSEEADVLSTLYHSDVLTAPEKRVLYRQYKSGVMSRSDLEKYAVIDLDKIQTGEIDRWAKAILAKKKGNKNIEAEDISFEITEDNPPTKKSVKPPKSETQTPPEAREAGDEVRQPVKNLNVDHKRFQNREEEFSEESVQNIIKAVQEGTFKKAKFDPIRTWKDPKDGKTYVLAGHSRTEAFKRLQTILEKGELSDKAKENLKAQGIQDFKSIPSKDMSGESEQDAINYAKDESNKMGTEETELARAKRWKEKRNEGKSEKAIREELKGSTTQQLFSYLKENGYAWDAIKAVQKSTDEGNKRRVFQIGEFLGEVRRRYPFLNDSHENEMFEYLTSGNGTKITSRPEFVQRLDNVINNVAFQADVEQPLNLNNKVSRGSNEQEAIDARDEVLTRMKSLERERADKKKVAAPGRVQEINREIAYLEKDLIRLNENIRKAKQGDQQQFDIFGKLPGQSRQAEPAPKKKNSTSATIAKKMNVLLEKMGSAATDQEKAKYQRYYDRYKKLVSKQYQGEQASAEKFYEPPMGSPRIRRKVKTVRVTVAPIFGGKVKLLRDIMVDLSKSTPNPIYYTKSPIKGRRSIGSYAPYNAAIAIKYKGDLDVTAHELGHSLDDRYGFLRAIPKTGRSPIELELKELSQWGSKPPKGHPNPQEYRYGEGVAEFIRAYLVNPAEAAQRFPNLTAHLTTVIPAETLKSINAFGSDIRSFAGLTGHGKVMSNAQFDPEKKMGGLASFFKPTSTSKDNFTITWLDRLANKFLNDKHYFEKSVKWLQEISGQQVDVSKDPTILAKLIMGANEKMDNIFKEGFVNKKNKRILDPITRKRMTFEWLMQPFDATDSAHMVAEQQEAISYMIALRTMELSARFGRSDLLTGIGAGIFRDIHVAAQRINEFRNLPKEKQERIEEAVRRYREYADRVLRYMVDKGRMSEEQYSQIKTDNIQYVALSRILESAPGEEIVVYRPTKGNKSLASTSKIVHAIKGSSALIKNPYESLIDIAAKAIRESDRNEAMLAFRALFRKQRGMGKGDPVLLGDIARPATSKDKNVVQIFVKGKSEYWQLDPDVYRSVKGLFDTAYHLPIVMTALPKLLRWSVTNFPVFAARNKVRDTQHRFVISDTKAFKGYEIYKSKRMKKDAKDMFQLFGGGQAGHYLMNDQFYYKMMDKAVKEMTGESNTIMSLPGKMWDGYQGFLSGSERSTRLEEYRSAFKDGQAKGMDQYNAMIYAAYKSRDLLDFSVSGEWMRIINQVVPFSNAAVQGLRKTIRSGVDNPAAFGLRFLLTAVLPTIIIRLIVHALGEDEEYENLPAYRRDLFYNIPVGPNLWITIPKAFEIGVMASGIERAVSYYVLDLKEAFKGYAGSVARSLMPVDDAALAGGYRPFIEILTNHDFFRDQAIIPPDELKLHLELRRTDKGSRIGKLFQGMIGVDSRQIDHFIKSSGSYYGDFVLRLSDIGRGDSRYNFGVGQTGFAKNDPVYESKDVQWVIKFVEENGIDYRDPLYMEMKSSLSDYFGAPADQKDEAGDATRQLARNIKSQWDTDDFRAELEYSRQKY